MTTFTDDFTNDTINQSPGWTVYRNDGAGNPFVDAGVLKPALSGGTSEIRMFHNSWAPEEDQNFVIFYKLSATVSGEHTALCKLKLINGGAHLPGGAEQYVKARIFISPTPGQSDLYLEIRRSSGATEILAQAIDDAALDHTANEWHAVGVEVQGDNAYARWWHVGIDSAKDSFDPFTATPNKMLGPITMTGANAKTFGTKVRGTFGVRINADSTSHQWDRFTARDFNGYTPIPPIYSDSKPFKKGNWPTANYVPHASDPYFGKPQRAALNALPLSNSQDIVDWLIAAGPPSAFEIFLEIRAGGIADTSADYNDATYWAEPDDPLMVLKSNNYYGPFPYNGTEIRVPEEAVPAQSWYDPVLAPGKDSHMSIVQPDGKVWSMYKVMSVGMNGYDNLTEFPGGKVANEVHFRWGGYCTHIDGSANDAIGEGAVAANWNAMAGRIRAQELEEGKVDHPLFIIVPCVQHPEIWPSQGNALKCVSGNPGWGVGEIARTGQWFRLDYSEAEIDALTAPAWKKAIWKAMAVYGMFVGDTKGNAGTTIGIESGTTYTAFGYTDPWDLFAEARYGTPEGAGIRISSEGYYELDIETGIDITRMSTLDPFSLEEGLFPGDNVYPSDFTIPGGWIPTVDVVAGPNVTRLSSKAGKNQVVISWQAPFPIQQYIVALVNNPDDTLQQSAADFGFGAIVATETLTQAENTSYEVTIPYSTIAAGSPGDGAKRLKVFVRGPTAQWSEL